LHRLDFGDDQLPRLHDGWRLHHHRNVLAQRFGILHGGVWYGLLLGPKLLCQL
jgi:hypothetical protein